MYVYEIRPHKDTRGADLISERLQFGRLWYGEPSAIENPVDFYFGTGFNSIATAIFPVKIVAK